MKLNAVFHGKEPSLEESPCEIGKVVTLTDEAYGFFKKHLLYHYDFIRDARNEMGVWNGVRQCILVMGQSSEDGILVDSSGADYARYTAPFLGARSYLAMQNLAQTENMANTLRCSENQQAMEDIQ